MVEEADPNLNIPVKMSFPPLPANLENNNMIWYHSITPTTGVINAGVINGTYKYTYQTGANEFVPLNSLRLFAAATGANATNSVQFGGNEIGALIQRASFWIQQVKVAESNNYPYDAHICKMLSYNVLDLQRQGYRFVNDGYNNSSQLLVNADTVIFEDRLDGLWLPDTSNVIPPNCLFMLELNIEPNHELLMSLGPLAGATAYSKGYTRLELKFQSFVNTNPLQETYVLRLITPQSFRSTLEAQFDNNWPVNQNATRVSLILVDTALNGTADDPKIQGVVGQPVIDFLTVNRLLNLTINYGQQVIPTYNISTPAFTTSATYRELYHVISERMRSTTCLALSYEEWLTKPIFSFPIVKTVDDRGGSNVRVRMNFNAVVANSSLFVCIHIQNIISIMYDVNTRSPVLVRPSA